MSFYDLQAVLSVVQHNTQSEENAANLSESEYITKESLLILPRPLTNAIYKPFSMEKFDETKMFWTRWLQHVEGVCSIFTMLETKKVKYLLHRVGMEMCILTDRFIYARREEISTGYGVVSRAAFVRFYNFMDDGMV